MSGKNTTRTGWKWAGSDFWHPSFGGGWVGGWGEEGLQTWCTPPWERGHLARINDWAGGASTSWAGKMPALPGRKSHIFIPGGARLTARWPSLPQAGEGKIGVARKPASSIAAPRNPE